MALPQSGHMLHTFRGSLGKLQQQLGKGELTMFTSMPTSGSGFIQLSRGGEVINVQMVTVGIVCTSPDLKIPDIVLLAGWQWCSRCQI